MTRGKYASRAANRQVTAEVEATESGYRRQIVRLTQERDEARNALAGAKDAHTKEARVLRAQVTEGTSDRVEALSRELNRIREERDSLRAWNEETLKKNDKFWTALYSHFIAEHDVKPGRAVTEEVARVLLGDDFLIYDRGAEEKIAKRYGVEALRFIRRARGEL